jgi:ABC-2 type transport system ATP-binding protein
MIILNNVDKSFSGTEVLRDINLEISDSSIYGLVGYNGAGKTTLLNLIGGLYRPDMGEILADVGDDRIKVTANDRFKRETFSIFDESYYLPQSTPAAMARYYRGFYRDFSPELFAKLCKILEIDPDKRLNSFSKGMKRKSDLCFALASKARYLLLDESFDGLDPGVRMTVKDLLLEYMADTGATVVMASHNLHELEGVCDSVGLLNRQNIVFSCDIDDARAKYRRYRVGFSREVTENKLKNFDLGNLRCEGKLVTFVSGKTPEALRERLSLVGDIVLFEEHPMTLEEIFRYETTKGGEEIEISGLFS